MRYLLYSDTKVLEEYGSYTAYGIEAVRHGRTVCIIGDISPDRDKMLRLIQRFNEEKLALSHLEQAVEDFLYDFQV